MDEAIDVPPRAGPSDGRIIAAAAMAAAVVTSGVQGIAPAIPAIQDEFALSAAQVALITSIYLFPSMFSAMAAGALADRVGTRPVFTGSLVLFGLGPVVLLVDQSLSTLLAVRFVQGAAFGAVLSMSVGIIGAIVPSGPAAAKAQGQRIIAMAGAEAVLPAAAGVLLALGWFASFSLQALALPVALLCWLVLPRIEANGTAGRRGGGLGPVVRSPAFTGVQVFAALRFVFKFAVLTYLPLLAVQQGGLSPAALGFALGVSAVLSATMAWLTEKLSNRWSSAQLIVAAILASVASVVAMALADGPVLVLLALLLFGIQDGVYGVAHNVLVTELAPAEARASYIGVTGTVRNIGKFTAPMIFGGATVFLSLSHSFLVLAAVGAGSLAFARRVIRAETAALDHEPPHPPGAGARPRG